jgi:hypothetical protein
LSPSHVSAAIKRAFPAEGAVPPSAAEVTAARDHEGLISAFADRPWPTLSPEELRYNSVGLALFTDRAFAYYLPAFMLAELHSSEVMDVVPEHIAYAFVHSQCDPCMFSSPQREAIATFFRLLSEQNGGASTSYGQLFEAAMLLVEPPA